MEDDSWRVQLVRAVRDGNIEFIEGTAAEHPNAIHETLSGSSPSTVSPETGSDGVECSSAMPDGMFEWEFLKWYEFGEATCLYVAASFCQLDVVRWLLENGVDRDKPCYYGQKPIDVVGQCRLDAEAASAIRQALSEELRRPRAPVPPSCVAKIGYEETVRKVYETIQLKGATKRVPKRVTETVASCKATVSWPTYWLSDITSSSAGKLGGGVTYELQYRSRTGQDWIVVATKTSNKILTGLMPGQTYGFRVRALNSAGWGDFSETTELVMPSERKKDSSSKDLPSETTD